ncbi:hypothetical protein KNU71_gp041 [Streptomyces phage Braelyn]|uniref:Uncharacterized protein n=1 Tax=Streptomyces phage Braelyn TaxID=2593356 RepID=A0A514U2I4_9CAUD|nr:hypothetical protein KNU71_gp016 [Streptomyces phage Braelyn]YP_010104115.1 hypothetical protein KNU71_gp041 [Streptomyces phage Braelyn]WNM72898.1 hypothetical protein SEA_PERSIMMON_15 [Streptomyces phage Persimmon]QDK02874.1 hypothetical protein SEA_BRAELYN_16 [Streptomyces phage Braelyn]QDK03075.1 hypothetical protein SEA_BRAELYN_261 [Streptomyces phage Braelyn]WNM73108.1 hypothetical protein SEA_PERSIMMON_266 [Streptomyces phage Persimmon]
MRTQMFSLEDVKAIAKDQNNHFFDRAALRFFNSRISEMCYSDLQGKTMFFVSSERFDDMSPRLYTVRVAKLDENGHLTIDTVSEFQEYASRDGAHSRAKRERAKFFAESFPSE